MIYRIKIVDTNGYAGILGEFITRFQICLI